MSSCRNYGFNPSYNLFASFLDHPHVVLKRNKFLGYHVCDLSLACQVALGNEPVVVVQPEEQGLFRDEPEENN
jgi:hypothetical protein